MNGQNVTQENRQKRKLIDWVIFSPLAILTLTQVLPSNVILSLLSMLLISTFPGFALLNRLKVHRPSRFQDLFFSVLFSVFLLQVVYAGYSVFCFGLGFEQSLTKVQVFIIAILILLLSSISLRKNIDELTGDQFIFEISLRLQNKNFFLYLIPLLLPLMSLIAVTRLNILNDSITTIIFLYFSIGILLILLLGSFLRISSSMHYLIFYCAILGLLFGSTFRGDGGFWGADINQEFAIATRVLLQEHWIPITQKTYNSMLSVTVLPVVISILTKFSLTIIFKLFYPFMAALIPIAMYSLLRRFVDNSVAMCVVIIETIASITFIPQLIALTRQIIGIAFFVGIIIVVFEPTWNREKKTKIILLLFVGLSTSHYSSAYLTAAIFAFAGILSILLRRLSLFSIRRLMPLATLSLGLSMIVIVLLWNLVLNNSAREINNYAESIISKGPNFLPNSGNSFLDRWVRGVNTGSDTSLEEFKIEVLKANARAYPNFSPAPISLSYEVVKAEYPIKKLPLGDFIPKLFFWLYVIINSIFQGLVPLFLILGMFLFFGIIPNRSQKIMNEIYLNKANLLIDLFPLSLVSFAIAAFLRISGTSGTLYNAERAGFQLALIFSLPIALLLNVFIRRTSQAYRIRSIIFVISCFVFLQQATNLVTFIYGAPVARLSSNITNDSAFVISENEKYTARWLHQYIPKNSYLQSDVGANLVNSQWNIFNNKPFIGQTSPFGIFKGSYIYLSTANLESGITRQIVGGLSKIRVPFDYLDQNFSVVYSSGGTRVYR